MIEPQMLTEQRLREVLAAIPGVETVMIHEDERRWVARVLASRFETMDEAERQAEIYNVLLRELSSYELEQVAFVFTDTPREYAEPSTEMA
jgi:acid stress-induced BolA-like protein IbaG/YrbA